MAKKGNQALRSGLPAALLLGCTALVAVPTAGLAIGAAGISSASSETADGFAGFTPASNNPRLAELLSNRPDAVRGHMRFTPAGIPNRPDRSITVAVRVNGDAARAISIRSAIAEAKEQVGNRSITLAPTRYNLGVSRGYQSFVKPRANKLAVGLGEIDMPDLASFKPSDGAAGKPSRFNARLSLEEKAKAGAVNPLGEQNIDLAGSYRVTRNLDLTAGVRYSQDRDAIAPLTDSETDSQAVYVGTQFRF